MRQSRDPAARERYARVLLVAFGLVTLADLVCLAAGSDIGHALTKPLLMPLLAAHAGLCGGPGLLVAALLFGWGGDTLLLSDHDAAFLAGMSSFACGHLCYLLLFRRYGAPPEPHARKGTPPGARLAGGYGLALATTVTLLWPDLPPELRVPVAAYSVLLTAMAYRATRLGPTAALGGVLFMLSDTLIATGVAEWPQLPRPDFWIMLTYIAAQLLLVRGVMDRRTDREVMVTP
ncbi:lysoplasmalogenase [Streptomyces sporangiiformans]|uniref:Lysoplasmalogenase n=1 Tax=Streptomyces sporangiiformans TaxID=2315329 RepID=A0A505DKM8_9ACTN|nr:lysoplasmalogenase [Streptomyces sporangiiformans]TPQ19569.1 lysoplasmalogenase [Streptomyces sporangiiformans]